MLQPLSDEWSPGEAAHLLRRAGFGGSPAEIVQLHALGRSGAVDWLLSPREKPDAFPLPVWAEPERAEADARERQEEVRKARVPQPGLTPAEAEQQRRLINQKYQRQVRTRIEDARDWWFRRIFSGQAPLQEKMVLFWHDHFATSVQKVRQPVAIIRQNQLFRRHALGSFRQLTHAVLRDPAMMLYLDTQNSKKGRPNENFPRELMELFTLGEGHYSEQDVKEAARALTGYQLNRIAGTVIHNRRQWDSGVKTIFGKSGHFSGIDLVDLIFGQPQASRMLPAKLWAYFVAENPSTEMVDALATSFREADFQTAPLLRKIFLSREFNAPQVVRDQIKCPVQYLVQLFRELELPSVPHAYVLSAQQELGQVLLAPPNVAGWDWGKGWINTSTLLARYNIAGFITGGASEPPGPAAVRQNRMAAGMRDTSPRQNVMTRMARNWKGPDYEKLVPRPLREDPAAVVDSLIARFFQAPLPERQRAVFVEYAVSRKGVIFTNHEVAELCHLMLSTPAYQLA